MFGVCAWEVLTRAQHIPYHDLSTYNQLMSQVGGGRRTLQIPAYVPTKLRALLVRCWEYDGRARPTMKHVANELKEIVDEMELALALARDGGTFDDTNVATMSKFEQEQKEGTDYHIMNATTMETTPSSQPSSAASPISVASPTPTPMPRDDSSSTTNAGGAHPPTSPPTSSSSSSSNSLVVRKMNRRTPPQPQTPTLARPSPNETRAWGSVVSMSATDLPDGSLLTEVNSLHSSVTGTKGGPVARTTMQKHSINKASVINVNESASTPSPSATSSSRVSSPSFSSASSSSQSATKPVTIPDAPKPNVPIYPATVKPFTTTHVFVPGSTPLTQTFVSQSGYNPIDMIASNVVPSAFVPTNFITHQTNANGSFQSPHHHVAGTVHNETTSTHHLHSKSSMMMPPTGPSSSHRMHVIESYDVLSAGSMTVSTPSKNMMESSLPPSSLGSSLVSSSSDSVAFLAHASNHLEQTHRIALQQAESQRATLKGATPKIQIEEEEATYSSNHLANPSLNGHHRIEVFSPRSTESWSSSSSSTVTPVPTPASTLPSTPSGSHFVPPTLSNRVASLLSSAALIIPPTAVNNTPTSNMKGFAPIHSTE